MTIRSISTADAVFGVCACVCPSPTNFNYCRCNICHAPLAGCNCTIAIDCPVVVCVRARDTAVAAVQFAFCERTRFHKLPQSMTFAGVVASADPVARDSNRFESGIAESIASTKTSSPTQDCSHSLVCMSYFSSIEMGCLCIVYSGQRRPPSFRTIRS